MIRALAAFAALAVALPLCGVAARAETLAFPVYSRTIFFLPVWVAERKGFFREEGITIAFQADANQDRVAEQLRSGELGVHILGPETVFFDPAHALRVVGGNAGKLPHFIIAKPAIRSLAQLRGANWGVISMNEGTTHIIPLIAEKAGLKPADYTMSPVGSAPTRWKLLQAGQIDAGLQPFPLSYEAEAAGYSNLGWTGTYEPDWQFTAVVANDAWAKQHRATLVGFLRALRRGTAYIAAHRDEAAQIAVDEVKTSPAFAARAVDDTLRLGILDPTLEPNGVGLRRVYDASKPASAGPYEESRFVDRSYLDASRR